MHCTSRERHFLREKDGESPTHYRTRIDEAIARKMAGCQVFLLLHTLHTQLEDSRYLYLERRAIAAILPHLPETTASGDASPRHRQRTVLNVLGPTEESSEAQRHFDKLQYASDGPYLEALDSQERFRLSMAPAYGITTDDDVLDLLRVVAEACGKPVSIPNSQRGFSAKLCEAAEADRVRIQSVLANDPRVERGKRLRFAGNVLIWSVFLFGLVWAALSLI